LLISGVACKAFHKIRGFKRGRVPGFVWDNFKRFLHAYKSGGVKINNKIFLSDLPRQFKAILWKLRSTRRQALGMYLLVNFLHAVKALFLAVTRHNRAAHKDVVIGGVFFNDENKVVVHAYLRVQP